MKMFLVLLTTAALAWLGYQYVQKQGGFANLMEKFRPQQTEAETETEVEAEVETVTATPPPTPAVEETAEAEVVVEIPLRAPEGVFYLLNRHTIVTGSGVTGVEAGTQVRLVRREGDHSVVKTATLEMTLPNSLLTNDLRKLDAITRAQQAARALPRENAQSGDRALQPAENP